MSRKLSFQLPMIQIHISLSSYCLAYKETNKNELPT